MGIKRAGDETLRGVNDRFLACDLTKELKKQKGNNKMYKRKRERRNERA